MNAQTLGIFRDLAALLLCLECFLFIAVPGVVLFFVNKYFRRVRPFLHRPLVRVLSIARRVQKVTDNSTRRVANVPIRLQMLGTQVNATARALLSSGPTIR